MELSKDLEKYLDLVGDTPIDEPKLLELAERGAEFSEVMLEILSRNNKKQQKTLEKELIDLCEKHGLEQVIELARKAINKFQALHYEDGTVKTTKNTENCNLPNIFEAEKFNKLQTEIVLCFMDRAKLDTTKKKEIKDLDDKSLNLAKDLEIFALEISGLDIDKLSLWEKETVVAQITKCVNNAYDKTSVGKH